MAAITKTETEIKEQANVFASGILDQAKRIQDKKRVAEPSEDTRAAKVTPPAEAVSTAVAGTA